MVCVQRQVSRAWRGSHGRVDCFESIHGRRRTNDCHNTSLIESSSGGWYFFTRLELACLSRLERSYNLGEDGSRARRLQLENKQVERKALHKFS